MPTISVVDLDSLTTTTAHDLLHAALKQHAQCYFEYEKFRQIKSTCFNEAKSLAGDKPLTDTYWDRAVENKYGNDFLENGRRLFLCLQALAVQVQGLSSLLSAQIP